MSERRERKGYLLKIRKKKVRWKKRKEKRKGGV